MAYYLRSKMGETKAQLSNEAVEKLRSLAEGHYVVLSTSTNGLDTLLMKSDYVYGTERFGVFIWAGDTLDPKKE